jgi:hypothetical protein
MTAFLAEFDGIRNQLCLQAFCLVMNFDRSVHARSEDAGQRVVRWTELPPAQAGLSAALRRAFAPPRDDRSREFEELLRKLA